MHMIQVIFAVKIYNGTQNCLVFQPIGKYLKGVNYTNIGYVLSWKSIGLSELDFCSMKTNNYLLNPRKDQYETSKIRLKFDGSFLN